jgi:hypothetical protein
VGTDRFLYCPYLCTDLHKFGVQNIRAVRLGHFELHENLRSEGRTFVVAVNEVTSSDTCVL